MIADYHIHSNFSNDSTYPMEETIKQAIKLGINEICFTDHIDYLTNDLKYVVDYEKYLEEYKILNEKYKKKISIKFGAEFGVQMHTINEFKRDFNQYDFDFVILSNHQIDDLEFWTNEYQRGKSQLEYNRGYYQATLDVVNEYKEYSVLGHMDMIKRYDDIGILEDEACEDIIKAILKQVIKDGKGIEVNTSCYRYELPDLTPSTKILRWYYELGGKILTIGSDSHTEEHLGYKIIDVREKLKNIGFKEFCTFEKMKPIFHKL